MGKTHVFAANKEIGAKNPPITLSPQVQAINDAFTSASKTVNATVVNIKVITESKAVNKDLRDLFRFFGGPEDAPSGGGEEREMPKQEGAGSGVIISTDGYIITNNHVVDEAKEDGITVILSDKKEYKAKLIGKDPLTDLAVIKVEANNLPVAHIGNSDEVAIGEMVIAVGNPLGLNSTVTSGIVSAIGRGALGLNRDRYAVENFIQTDAAINPGNSGGALVDTQGHLLGINTAIYSRSGGSLGIGFAIPVTTVKTVMDAIIKNGQVVRGWIGVEPQDITPELAESFNLQKSSGTIIAGVLKGGPADKAGVKPGDILISVAGKPVSDTVSMLNLVAQLSPGETVKVTVLRKSREAVFDLTVGRRPRMKQPRLPQGE